MMEYVGSLPQSRPEIREPFESGTAAMEAYRWDEAIGDFTRGMEHAEGAELAALHGLVGRSHLRAGRWQDALSSFEESSRLAEMAGDKRGNACALASIGVIVRDQGEMDRAQKELDKAVRLAREAGARREEAVALRGLSGVHFYEGRLDEFIRCSEQALKMSEETGDKSGQARALHSIGLGFKDEREREMEFYDRALKLAREAGARREEAGIIHNIGVDHAKNKDFARALELYRQALGIHEEMNAVREATAARFSVGSALVETGRPDEAVAILLQGLDTSVEMKFAGLTGPERFRYGLGRCLDAMGREEFVAACVKAGKPKEDAGILAGLLGSPELVARRKKEDRA
jgi:tetratricopeptide (TPR) repeat protein